MAEVLVLIQKNEYSELRLQTVAVLVYSYIKMACHVAATVSYTYWEIEKQLHEKKLYQFGKGIAPATN